MPIIRYRTRDLTRLLPPTSRSMRRMQKVTGRSDDMLIIRGVNVFPTQLEEQLLSINELSPHYHITVDKQGNMDSLSMQVEASSAQFAQDQGLANTLQGKIKSFIGVSCKIEILAPQQLARSEGKAVRVTDNR